MAKRLWLFRDVDWEHEALERLKELQHIRIKVAPLKESLIRRTGVGVSVAAYLDSAASEELFVSLMEAYGLFNLEDAEEEVPDGDEGGGDGDG